MFSGMFFGRKTKRQIANSARFSSRYISIGLLLSAGVSVGFLAGCGEANLPSANIPTGYEPWATASPAQVEITPVAWQAPPRPVAAGQPLRPDLAPPMPGANTSPTEEFPVLRLPNPDLEFASEPVPTEEPGPTEPAEEIAAIETWSFPTNHADATSREFSVLVPLPPVEEEEVEKIVKQKERAEAVVVAGLPKSPSLFESPAPVIAARVIAQQLPTEKTEIAEEVKRPELKNLFAQPPSLEECLVEVVAVPLDPLEVKVPLKAPAVEVWAKSVEQPIEQPIAELLPPQAIYVAEIESPKTPETHAVEVPSSVAELTEIASLPQRREPFVPHFDRADMLALFGSSPMPVLADLTEQQQLLDSLSQNSSAAVTGVLTDGRVNELAKTKIQHAYAMAGRGALYVARQELIEVLRMVSQAKDAQQGTPGRSKSLAAGLRALREAEDFAPRGTQLEAELDITVLCASHRTPIAKQADANNLLPRLMMDRYLRYAQLQLGVSVAGEPAGSMALHALGKLNSQLGRVEPEKNRLADRHAIAFQQAALLAHNQNHLAAHELGVLLATSGHYTEAEQLLQHVAARESNAVVYRNLARVQEKMGQSDQALASRSHAQQLSQQGVTGTSNVQWVSPNQFAQGGAPMTRYTAAPTVAQRPRPTTSQLTAPQTAAPPANRLVIPGSRQAMQPRLRR